MGMILKGVLALFWLLVIPFAVGILFFHNRQARRAGEYVLTGYTVMLAMMEILALPMIYLNLPLHVLVVVYGGTCSTSGMSGSSKLLQKKKVLRDALDETRLFMGNGCGSGDGSFTDCSYRCICTYGCR